MPNSDFRHAATTTLTRVALRLHQSRNSLEAFAQTVGPYFKRLALAAPLLAAPVAASADILAASLPQSGYALNMDMSLSPDRPSTVLSSPAPQNNR